MTTTGSTVFSGLEHAAPKAYYSARYPAMGWRDRHHLFVAMVFLPELRVAGMQVFKSKAFEDNGKDPAPRASAIRVLPNSSIIYVGLALICMFNICTWAWNAFDATGSCT